jgi:hypothetical protein
MMNNKPRDIRERESGYAQSHAPEKHERAMNYFLHKWSLGRELKPAAGLRD